MPLEIIGPESIGLQGYFQVRTAPDGSVSTGRYGAGYPMTFYERRVTTRRRKPPPGTWKDPTPYERETRVSRHQECKWGSKSHHWAQPSYDYTGIPSEALAICENVSLALPSSNEINRVVTDALLKLKDQKVNLAQAWAERRMTADLLADTAKRIGQSVQALRKGNWRKAGRYLKQNWKKSPGSWLEYQYGWLPLLSDVYGSVEALKQADRSQWIMTVKSVFKAQSTEEQVFRNDGNNPLHPFDYDSWRTLKRTRGAFIRLDYIPSVTFFNALTQAGVTNPGVLFWETLPYSFVADWAYRVGDWLSIQDATIGWDFKSGSLTTRAELTSKVKLMRPKNPDPYGWRTFPTPSGTLFHRKKILTRTVYGVSPKPLAPVYKNPMSMGHVANALALLTQALKPGPVKFRNGKPVRA